jgi:hypothetical protein
MLGDIMDTITKTSVSRTKYYFINYGKKTLLKHHPIDQFNGKIPKPSKGIFHLHPRQRKFHKKLSQLVTTSSICNTIDEQQTVPRQQEEQEEDSSSDEKLKEESCPEFCIGKYVTLSPIHTPFLAKLFGSESKVFKSYLNNILLELFMTLGSKSTVDFEYKNGNRGRAILVPRAKNEGSFRRQEKNRSG